MRQRYIKDAKEKLASSSLFITDGKNYKGAWKSEVFKNNNELHIEVGTGKGKFIMELAKRNPNINYLAIEKYDSVLLRLKEKLDEEALSNIRLLIMDATTIEEYFATGEVDKIYLNFSDPWPKKAHAKRRLTSPLFIARYNNILNDKGSITFKTDNRGLFEYSLETFANSMFSIYDISLDLHNDDRYLDNIKTEYEEKWEDKGPIYLLNAKKK